MGLGLIELVMEVEECFGVTLREEGGEKLVTVGDIHEFVWTHVDRTLWPSEEQCFERLRELVARQLDVRIEKVTKEARLIADLEAD